MNGTVQWCLTICFMCTCRQRPVVKACDIN